MHTAHISLVNVALQPLASMSTKKEKGTTVSPALLKAVTAICKHVTTKRPWDNFPTLKMA